MKTKNSNIYRPASIFRLLFVLGLMSVIVLGSGCGNDSNFTALKAKIISPGIDIEIKEGEAVFFKGLATGGSPPYKYLWHLGSVFPDISGQHTHEIVFKYEGAYTATFTVIDRNGNKDTDAISIVVISAELLD